MVAAKKGTPNTKQMLQAAKPKKAATAPPPDNGLPQGEELDKYIQEMADWAAVYGGGHPSNSPFPNLGNKVTRPRPQKPKPKLGPISNTLWGQESMDLFGEAAKQAMGAGMRAAYGNTNMPAYGDFGYQALGLPPMRQSDKEAAGAASKFIEGLLRSNMAKYTVGGDSLANLAGLTSANPTYERNAANTIQDLGWLALTLMPGFGGGGKKKLAGKGLDMAKQINATRALWGLLTE